MALKSQCKTLKKVGPKEEIFVLRAQDLSSPKTIVFWIGQNIDGLCPDAKLREALECALKMRHESNRKRAD
jgi:hypothetical protein